MKAKLWSIIIVITIIATLLLTGCKHTDNTTTITDKSNPTTSITINNNLTSTIPTVLPTQADFGINVSLNEPPKPGETAELTFWAHTYDANFYTVNQGTENAQAWMEFWWTNPNASYLEAKQAVRIPLEEVVISGDTTWEGNYKEKGHIELHCTIQLPREGIWRIEGYFTGEGWKGPICGYREIFVSKDIAAQMYELKSSSLDYLTYFDYGFLKDARKIDYLTEDTRPQIVELDISKAPVAGEKVTLTCTVASLHDVANWSMQIEFYRRLAGDARVKVPSSEFLVEGELQWQGDLKQAEPTVFTTTIKFPEEGDWEIVAYGNSQQNIASQKFGADDGIDITITLAISYYGWKTQYFTQTTNTTQNPTIITVIPTDYR